MKGRLRFSECDRESGWTREVAYLDEHGFIWLLVPENEARPVIEALLRPGNLTIADIAPNGLVSVEPSSGEEFAG